MASGRKWLKRKSGENKETRCRGLRIAVCLNCLVIVGLLSDAYTTGGAELFYGATLLVASWRGQPGCEATVVSNWLLERDDQVGCPIFSPIDRAEARRGAMSSTGRER
jgi:hypothetical protein